MRRHPARIAVLLALCATLPLALSCTRVVPVRTLPGWVRGIYVPMVQNRTPEPGLEDLATQLIQQEFLADGRLGVVQKDRADLQLVATIEEFAIREDDFDNDAIASSREATMVVALRLLEPFDDPFEPREEIVADLGLVSTNYRFNSDPRSTFYEPEPDVKRDALTALARQVVFQTITGFPVELQGLPTGAEQPEFLRPREEFRGDLFRSQRLDDGNF